MPTVDPAATRAAAGRLSEAAEAVQGGSGLAGITAAAGELNDSTTRHLLDDVQVVIQLRLLDVRGELTTLGAGMTELADNVDDAMNG